MKKYKLVKKYPSLPKNWEVGMIVGQGDSNAIYATFSPCSGNYSEVFLHYDEITRFPEFWEPMRELLFVTEDKVKIFKGDKFYYVAVLSDYYPNCYSGYAQEGSAVNKAYKYFSTPEIAKKYIDDNKSIYSKKQIRDILDLDSETYSDRKVIDLLYKLIE